MPVGVHVRLQRAVGAFERGSVDAIPHRQAEQLEVVARKIDHRDHASASRRPRLNRSVECARCARATRTQTLNDSPHPHASCTFGLLNLKPSFNPSRAKSSWVPSRYGRLFGSTMTRTPWLSNCESSGRTSSAYSS